MSELRDAIQASLRAADPYLDGGQYEGQEVGDDLDLSFFELHGVELTSCSLAGVNMQKASFYDCTLVGCDLSNANLDGAYFARTRFKDCKLEGTRLTKAFMKTCTLQGCQCRYMNLGESKLEEVMLNRCDLREAFLSDVRLRKGFRLEECDLTRADLFRTKLRGIDLSTCEIAGLTLGEDRSELRGAIISVEQAQDVAVMLGLRIKD